MFILQMLIAQWEFPLCCFASRSGNTFLRTADETAGCTFGVNSRLYFVVYLLVINLTRHEEKDQAN